LSAVAQISPDFDLLAMNHQRFGFFEEKPENLNISCLGQAQAETQLNLKSVCKWVP
jgi:hypothetical protein